jgi:hypothetical protein
MQGIAAKTLTGRQGWQLGNQGLRHMNLTILLIYFPSSTVAPRLSALHIRIRNCRNSAPDYSRLYGCSEYFCHPSTGTLPGIWGRLRGSSD